MKRWLYGCMFLLSFVLVALTWPLNATSAEKPAWQEEWDKTVAAAKKEGKLSIYITSGPEAQLLLRKSVKEKFGFDVEYTTGKSAELSTKIFSERGAGLYLADISLGGTGTFTTSLKPSGVLAPLKPLLLLPEVLDSKAYYDGKMPFVDKEGMYVFCFGSNVANTMAVNSNLVKPDDIKSYADLLAPKWKDRIILFDPTIGGTAHEWFFVTSQIQMNPDFHRQLARQNPLITRDKRLQVEWVARGKYSVALAPSKGEVSDFQKIGAPVKWVIPSEGRYLSGTDAVVYMDRAPHPNASKVLFNWLFSKEGMTMWSQITGMQTARRDVPTDFLPPETVRDAKTRYYNTAEEDSLIKSAAAVKISKEIYGPLLK